MNLEQKTSGAIETLQTTTRGGGCGIVGIGCGVVALLFMTMCVGSYFLTMHSSLPLSMIERALESEGNVQVEGLKGSISSGFEIELLKFESDECDEWNELRKVRFSYNGFINLLRTKRLIISEASVGGATIYTRIDGHDEVPIAGGINGEEIASDLAEEWNEMEEEFQDNDADELKELRIDLVSAKNVALVDPDTGARLEFDRVEFRNYQMLDGRITRLGELEVVSDQVDMETNKSTRYADEPVAWNLTGKIKPVAHKSLTTELPFDVDFAIQGSNRFQLHVNLFDGQVEIEEPYGDQKVVHLKDFSYGKYFETHSQLVPSNWNAKMTLDRSWVEVEQPVEQPGEEASGQNEASEQNEDAKRDEDAKQGESSQEADPVPTVRKVKKPVYAISVGPQGTFQLGQTQFQIKDEKVVFGPDEKMDPAQVIATGQFNDTEVTASITLHSRAPWFTMTLSATGMDPKDVWANLFYDKAYVALDGDQQKQVDAAVTPANPMHQFGEIEAVDF